MSNVSLARIMFGTNDNLHCEVPPRGHVVASHPGALRNGANAANETAATTSGLSRLFHKAWAGFQDK